MCQVLNGSTNRQNSPEHSTIEKKMKKKVHQKPLLCICLANPGNKFDTTMVKGVNAQEPMGAVVAGEDGCGKLQS